MQTVVLAAGEGTRMRPLTATQPKPMLPVAGQPLLAHVLDTAVEAGASRFLIVIGYYGDRVRAHFGDEYRGVPITYATQESQVGTADAVKAARPMLEEAPFAVLNGDSIYGPGMIDLYAGGPAIGTIRVDDPHQYGVVELDGEQVTRVIEKPADPPSDRVSIGAYSFPAAALDWLDVGESERGEYELTDVLARAYQERSVRAVTFDRWLDVGRPWELLAGNEWKLGELTHGIDGEVHDDATLSGPVVVESGATIHSGVTIEGPVLVRSDASVGPNAYLRGATVIGPGVEVGHAVEIKNSVVMADTAIPHLSYVGDSVIGRSVNLGAGTITANLRHDDEPIKMTVKDERVSTGRRKFGVVMGDKAKTGINTSINAGVVLSTGACTKPGESVTRDR